jgi:hypothetical protein
MSSEDRQVLTHGGYFSRVYWGGVGWFPQRTKTHQDLVSSIFVNEEDISPLPVTSYTGESLGSTSFTVENPDTNMTL